MLHNETANVGNTSFLYLDAHIRWQFWFGWRKLQLPASRSRFTPHGRNITICQNRKCVCSVSYILGSCCIMSAFWFQFQSWFHSVLAETITPQWTTASASSTTGAMAVHPPQWCGCCHVCWPWCNCCLLWCAWTFNMHTPSPSTSWILLQYHPTFQEVVQLISTPVACHFSLQGAHPTGFTAVHYP